MSYQIRLAKMDDYNALCEVLEEADALHREQLPAFYRQAPGGLSRERAFIANLLDNPNSAIFVAEEGGRVVGALTTEIRETPPIPIVVPRRYALIDTVAVQPAYRGRGIGRALMEQAETWARSHGAAMAELTVFLFNTSAIHLYEELGYTAVSQRMVKRL